MNWLTLLQGDVRDRLAELPSESIHCVVTSPPYWGLRDYGMEGQLGLEDSPQAFVDSMVTVFRDVRRVLRSDGTLWLNIGDSWAGYWGALYNKKQAEAGVEPGQDGMASPFTKMRAPIVGKKTPDWKALGLRPKCQIGIPWQLALALQKDGWMLRCDIIWHKLNPTPESCEDRPTREHDYLFLFSKTGRYFYDQYAVRQPCSPNTHSRIAKSKITKDAAARAADNQLFESIESAPLKGSNGVNPKAAANAPGVRANARMAAASSQPVISKNLRSVWSLVSEQYRGKHYATFPCSLVRPCVLAGTSAKGCCPQCGAPWVRVLETPAEPRGAFKCNQPRVRRSDGGYAEKLGNLAVQSVGWEPTCECLSEVSEPCRVLDPFGGSGTTGKVAIELGRRATLIELNPDSCEQIKERCDVTPGLPIS